MPPDENAFFTPANQAQEQVRLTQTYPALAAKRASDLETAQRHRRRLSTMVRSDRGTAEALAANLAFLEDLVAQYDGMREQGPYYGRLRFKGFPLEGEGDADTLIDVFITRFPYSVSLELPQGTLEIISWRAPAAEMYATVDPYYTLEDGTVRQVSRLQAEMIRLSGPLVLAVAPRSGASYDAALLERLKSASTGHLQSIVEFLDRTQTAAVRDRHFKGRLLLVDGAAGTGKTEIILHRVGFLLPNSPAQRERFRVLVIGPTKAFASYVEPLFATLGLGHVEVRTLHELLPAGLVVASGADPDRAMAARRINSLSFLAALDQSASRDPVERYRKALSQEGLPHHEELDASDLGPLLYALLAERPAAPYDVVVVDEAQDVSPVALRALTHLTHPHSQFILSGDLLQRLNLGLGLSSWRDAAAAVLPEDFDPRTNVEEAPALIKWVHLTDSYRVPGPILDLANAIASPYRPTGTTAAKGVLSDGERPVVVRDADPTNRIRAELQRARGRGWHSVAVIGRTDAQARAWAARLGWPRLQGEMHSGQVVAAVQDVKGLEFDVVLLVDVDPQQYPAQAGAAFALYTAVTRARRAVMLTYRDQPSPLLPR